MVAAIGALTQFVGVLLLALLLLALRRYADVRGYFGPWTLGWAFYATSLAAVVTRYVIVPRLGFVLYPIGTTVCDALYVIGKLLFYASLVAGAARYAGRRGQLRWVLGPAFVYAAIAWMQTTGLNGIIMWQAPVASGASAAAAVLLLRAPNRGRTVGSLVTSSSCIALAVLWVCYGIGFSDTIPSNDIPFFAFLGRYNSFIDLLTAIVLGFGMVVLVLEDAKHAADRAHAELSSAHESLRRIAAQDALTGALNRTAFRETASLGTALRAGSLVVVDLDNLKVVNDSYGHATGDRLLAYLAATLRRGIADDARLYRWGGDEFVVVLPGVAADVAYLNVSAILGQAPPLDVGADRITLAASLGTAPYVDGASLERAVDRADDSMYQDKQRRKGAGGTPSRSSIAIVR